MRCHAVPVSIVLASVILATPLRADVKQDCVHAGEPEARVAACTALIDAGAVAGTNLAVAQNNRGAAYDALDGHARAIEDFDRAIEINRDYAAAYYNRGRTYDSLGKHARAIEDYDRALEIDPDFADAYQNRGVSHESLGEFDKAQEDWKRAIEIAGEPRARWWQAYLKEKGHYAAAVDGLYGPGTERGLLACARDPEC